ncbi:MAG: Release factor glutamine methyltransferase, partial [Parcubacteria group bacterium]|nr:Release factor glutamine methyltransferase [Parcubacteria group bacterium]
MILPPHVSPQDIELLVRDKYPALKSSDASLYLNKEVRKDIERLAAGEPLAYVIGWIPFLGLEIGLASKPLIPRPETEWWTELLVEHLLERFGDAP